MSQVLLQGIRYLGSATEEYPFSVPVLHHLSELSFDTAVTIFVGENGSGKSTLLEGIAVLVDLPAIGGKPLKQDESLRHARILARQLREVRQQRIQRGFFLRAEDFFGFIRSLETMRSELNRELQLAEREARARDASDYAINQSRSPWLGQLSALQERYGSDPDAASHGESFLQLLQTRIVPQGLYLLDEPEAALSPMRQLALISLLKYAATEQDCQFILATHSPVLLAYPGARLLLFNPDGLQEVHYDDLEHVNFTRDFLNDPEAFLQHI